MLPERNSGRYGVFLSRRIFSRKLLPQGFAGSAIIFYLLSFIFGSDRQYDRCQRRTECPAGSDETSFEGRRKVRRDVWPPFFQTRCPRRLLSWQEPARSRSLVKRLVICSKRTMTNCLRSWRRRN